MKENFNLINNKYNETESEMSYDQLVKTFGKVQADKLITMQAEAQIKKEAIERNRIQQEREMERKYVDSLKSLTKEDRLKKYSNSLSYPSEVYYTEAFGKEEFYLVSDMVTTNIAKNEARREQSRELFYLNQEVIGNSNSLQKIISERMGINSTYIDTIFTNNPQGSAKESFAMYKGKTFDLDNPSETQLKVGRIYQGYLTGDNRLVKEQGNSYMPSKGLFLYSKPGRGKTHLTMVFAHELMTRYNGITLESILSDFNSTASENKERFSQNSSNYQLDVIQTLTQEIKGKRKAVKAKLDESQKKATSVKPLQDLVYVVHNDMLKKRVETEDHDNLLNSLSSLPYLVLDELWIKNGETKYANFFKELVESRYQRGNFGMFITSNMAPKETLAGVEAGRFDMVYSRLNEMAMFVSLDDQQEDYRHKSSENLFDSF